MRRKVDAPEFEVDDVDDVVVVVRMGTELDQKTISTEDLVDRNLADTICIVGFDLADEHAVGLRLTLCVAVGAKHRNRLGFVDAERWDLADDLAHEEARLANAIAKQETPSFAGQVQDCLLFLVKEALLSEQVKDECLEVQIVVETL